MKITMLRNAAAHIGCKLQEGQTGEVDADLGQRLVAMGIAVEGKEIQAVAKTPEVSKSKSNASK